ncbi:MAG: membrane protein insertase YidC [Hahellaceae bacterium]|nr:membrane protein insertase YidC [Hahellaceae bacterium]
MDIRRSIIFIGLAIVSYLMILEWNKDYGYKPSSTITQTVSSESNSFNLAENTLSSDNAEFTTPEQQSDGNHDVVTKSIEANAPLRVITINTDTMIVTIDLSGGNIVQTLLPNYRAEISSPAPLALLESNSRRYYTIKSGLFGRDGFDSSKNGPSPIYQASQTDYKLAEGQSELLVDLNYTDTAGVKVTKRYTFKRESYEVKVDYLIDNQSDKEWLGNFSGKIERDQSADPSQQSSMGMKAFLGMALSSPKEPYETFKFDALKETPVNQKIQGGWIAFIQHYFISAWIPASDQEHTYQTRVTTDANGRTRHLMGFISPAVAIPAGQQKTISAKLYIGPKIIDHLEVAAPKLELTVDYGWLFFIAKPLFLLLDFLHGLVNNWGVAIILVTVIVKALFFHLSATSYRSMANMRRVTPQLTRIREQYGDDRQRMSQAMMDLYKKEKINPLGGCLPVLVQMPVFISLYWVLMESVQLRQSPFFFWINDLSAQDPYFLLPILMGISMFIQMSLNPAPPDPTQARVMKLMPVIFTVFFLWFPSGLVLYWLVNNVLSIAQQYVITRQIEASAGKS